ncbi:MAG TPA: hypothetical protein VGF60_22140 [Xanthobacteraceae bacterium]|jgi:hypothetical protein
MLRTSLAAVAMVSIALCAVPAEAAKKQQNRQPVANSGAPSLDGRVLGYPRTCWSTTFIRDNRGVPVGPYCH